MTTQSTFTMTDLVLRLAGGQREGELIPVSTNKCFLGMEQNADGTAENPQCAIFRGPNGAAVKSYGDDVLINGAVATVHWLQEGDRIEFPNSMALEVAQLGWIETACGEYVSVENEYRELAAEPTEEKPSPNCCEVESGCTADGTESDSRESIGCQDAQDESAQDDETIPDDETILSETTAEPVESPKSDGRLELMESQIGDIQKQNGQTQERFDKLDGQLGNLGGQLSQLVSMVSSNNTPQLETGFSPESETLSTESLPEPEETFMNFDGVEPQADVTEFEAAKLESSEVAAPEAESPEVDSTEFESEYSYRDDDDEKIMTFDSSESDPEPAIEAAPHIEITDSLDFNESAQDEVDSRLAEMERVFGGQLAELDNESVNTDSETNQPVNGQLSDTFESVPHSRDEEVAPFADISSLNAMDEPTVSGETDSLSETPQDEVSLAKQLIMEVEQLEEPAPVEEPTPVEEPVAEETTQESTVADSSEPSSGNESVSELLERMKSEGQWDGIPDEGANVSPVEPVEPIAAVAEVADVPTGDGDDVEDYMSQLLTRMRGGDPATPQPAKPVAKQRPTQKNKQEVEEEETFVPPENPLKADEFKPMRKAQRIGSLSAMRELANSSARSAVQKSEHTRRQALGYLQVGIALASFSMACYFLLVGSTALFDTGFILGILCVSICGYLCFRFYKTMQHNELVESLPKKTDKSKDEAQQNETQEASAETKEA